MMRNASYLPEIAADEAEPEEAGFLILTADTRNKPTSETNKKHQEARGRRQRLARAGEGEGAGR